MAENEILNLSTLAVPPTVVINGHPYNLRTPESLSLLEEHRVVKQAGQVYAILADTDLNEEKLAAVEALVDGLVRLLLPQLPDEVLGVLYSKHKLNIVQAFTGLQQAQPQPAEAPAAPAAESSGPTESLPPASASQ